MTNQRKIVQRSAVTIFLSLLLLPSLCSALDFKYPAKVERVIDGDTIVVDLSLGLGVVLNDQKIRFYGIDAWETRGEEREKGLLAKVYVEEQLASAATVEIEIRPEWGRKGQGKYGRWMGVVYVDGENLNEELLDQGHAKVYPDQPSSEHPLEEPGIPEETGEVAVPFRVVAVCFQGDPEAKDEWILIENVSQESYGLKGWTITDDDDHEFEIREDITFFPGSKLAIANTKETNVPLADYLYYLNFRRPWMNNKGDIITILDNTRKQVLSYDY